MSTSTDVDAPLAPLGQGAAELATFHVTTDGYGAAVIVNGENVAPHVGALSLVMQAGMPATLSLRGVAKGSITGRGVVQVVEDREERDAIAAFLDAVDPDELERAALESTAIDQGGTRAMLRILRCWATGEAP